SHFRFYPQRLALHVVLLCVVLFFLLRPPPPSSTLFPYTTLFRSHERARCTCAGRSPRAIGRRTTSSYGRAGPGASSSAGAGSSRSEEHTSELQSLAYLVCRLLLEKKKKKNNTHNKYRTDQQ